MLGCAQFLCHYFETALLHGLRPTVLGWDSSVWASPERKPWTYYLGGKLVLPLEYLEKCAYPDDVCDRRRHPSPRRV